eukprot:2046854-Pleurochrysis_carterae.AAC.2
MWQERPPATERLGNVMGSKRLQTLVETNCGQKWDKDAQMLMNKRALPNQPKDIILRGAYGHSVREEQNRQVFGKGAHRTAESLWATMTVVVALSVRSAASTCRSPSASSALVASSSSSTRGRLASARASASRCRCPPDRLRPPSPTRESMPDDSASTKASAPASCSTCDSADGGGGDGMPKATLSATLRSSSAGSCEREEAHPKRALRGAAYAVCTRECRT